MEIAATFYYVTASIIYWVIGVLVIVLLVYLIKTLKIIQDTAIQVRESVTNFDMIKQAIASGITSVIHNFFGQRKLKGGVKHVSEK